MTKIEIIANIVAFIGCLLMVATGLIKNKRGILITQSAQMMLQGLANVMLGGVSGAISSFLGVLRNVCSLKFDFTWPIKIFFILLQAVLTIVMNTAGWLGWLPFIACVLIILVLDSKNEVVLKTSIIIGLVCWMVYDFNFKNYAGFAFDCFTFISTIIGVILILRDRKKPL